MSASRAESAEPIFSTYSSFPDYETALAALEPTTDEQPVPTDMELGDVADTDTSPLLGAQRPDQTPARRSATRILLQGFRRLGTAGTEAIRFAAAHPINTFIATATSLTNAIMAFTSNPSQLVNTVKKMSGREFAMALAHAISSLLINTLMNAFFLATCLDKLQKSLQSLLHPIDKPWDFLKAIALLFVGFAAAISLAAIAYDSFSWAIFAYVTALAPAFLSLVVNFASRFVGVDVASESIINSLNADGRLRRKTAYWLQNANVRNQGIRAALEAKFNESKNRIFALKAPHEPIDTHELRQLVLDMHAYLEQHPNFINTRTGKQLFKQYSLLCLQIIYAGMVMGFGAGPFALMSWQKGRDGIDIMSDYAAKLTGSSWRFGQMDTMSQAAWSFITCIAPFALSSLTLLKLPNTTQRILSHLYHNPEDIPLALMLMLTNILAATSPLNLGFNLVNNRNIFGLEPNATGDATAILCGANGVMMNITYSNKNAGLAPAPELATPANLNLSQLVKILNSSETLGFFAKPAAASAPVAPVQIIDLGPAQEVRNHPVQRSM